MTQAPGITLNRVLHAVIFVALFGTSACGKRDATGQTVAIVNGEDITVSDLNLELSTLPPGQRAAAKAKMLQALVTRKLLAQDAKKRGIERSPEFVLEERRTHDLMLAQRALQGTVQKAPEPATEGEIADYLAAHPDIGAGHRLLLVDQLQFSAPTSAARLAALAPARTLAELAAILKGQGVAVRQSRAQLDTAEMNEEVLTKIATLQPGEPIIAVNGANSVASAVVETRAAPIAPVDARAIARKQIESQRFANAFKQYENTLRNTAQIVYSKESMPRTDASAQ